MRNLLRSWVPAVVLGLGLWGAAVNSADAKTDLEKQYGMGPYPYEVDDFVRPHPVRLRPFLRSLYIEGERNAVLNFNRVGIAAMELGEYRVAAWALDNALLRIESVYADNPTAKQALKKFSSEDVKDFKGEPYERAMAYYYRGLVYFMEGDFENARASFMSGEFQDTVAEQEQFEADFAVLNFLAGWASKCDGSHDLADDYYGRAYEYSRSLQPPLPRDNTLLIAEMGYGPVKVGAGEHKEKLTFARGAGFSEARAVYVVDTEEATVVETKPKAQFVNTGGWGAQYATPVMQPQTETVYEMKTNSIDLSAGTSIYQQAATRGGRPVDHILEGKAQFKENMTKTGGFLKDAGTATALAGALGGDAGVAGIGIGVSALGGIFGGIGNKAKPAADIRYWDGLPDAVAIKTTHLEFADVLTMQVRWEKDPDDPNYNERLAEETFPAMVASHPECTVIWARSRSSLKLGEHAPGARLSWNQMKKRKKAVQAKDKTFREELELSIPIGDE
jgi:hypothetical protein